MARITVEGEITLDDGTRSRFLIMTDESGYPDAYFQQWGATAARLGETVELVSRMRDTVAEGLYNDDASGEW